MWIAPPGAANVAGRMGGAPLSRAMESVRDKHANQRAICLTAGAALTHNGAMDRAVATSAVNACCGIICSIISS